MPQGVEHPKEGDASKKNTQFTPTSPMKTTKVPVVGLSGGPLPSPPESAAAVGPWCRGRALEAAAGVGRGGRCGAGRGAPDRPGRDAPEGPCDPATPAFGPNPSPSPNPLWEMPAALRWGVRAT